MDYSAEDKKIVHSDIEWKYMEIDEEISVAVVFDDQEQDEEDEEGYKIWDETDNEEEEEGEE